MKYIITESQHNRLWILRRYDVVKKAFQETMNYVKPCSFDNFDDYESYFYNFLMDELHPEFYLIDGFDYNGVKEELKDLYYVNVTEEYYTKKQNC
jgi:hypothetical protein